MDRLSFPATGWRKLRGAVLAARLLTRPDGWPATRARLRRIVWPLPGDRLPLAGGWRWLYWGGLAALLLGGVMLPYLWPAVLPAPAAAPRTQPAPGAATTPPNLPAGTRLRDCPDPSCPWLVVIPAGQFLMGSPKTEDGHQDDEGPQHQVTVPKAFALMETHVTVGLYKVFTAETGYQGQGGCYVFDGKKWNQDPTATWRKPFADADQADNEPVVCISWDDAQVFVEWMSRRTGQVYRLPSEAEWEYAARAGSATAYSFGDAAAAVCQYANVADQRMKQGFKGADPKWGYADCDDGHVYTAPVASFKANSWGLYDMHGNAWQWTQDCYEPYKDQPSGAAAIETPNCSTRTLRGGAWNFNPIGARSAGRYTGNPTNRNLYTGFRLARMLP